MKSKIIISIVALVLGFILGSTVIKPKEVVKEVLDVSTEIEYVEEVVETVSYKPGKRFIRVDTQYITEDVDTAAILRDYYTVYTVTDTLCDDSTLFVSLYDTITQNEVIYRKPTIVKNYPVVIRTETVEVPDNGWFVGGFIGTDFGGAVHYKINNHLVGARFGTNTAVLEYSIRIGRK